MSRDDARVIWSRSNKLWKIPLPCSSLRDLHYAKDTQTWTAKKFGCGIVIISEPFRRTCQKGKSTWVKINFVWKFVNKSQNKAQQIALLTLTMAKPLWGGRYFHPENCCGPWDPWVARRTRDYEYFCRWSKNRSGPIQSHWEQDGLPAFAGFQIVRRAAKFPNSAPTGNQFQVLFLASDQTQI